MPRRSMPDGWLDYTTHNTTIAGTRIIPFKSPLKHYAFMGRPNIEPWVPGKVMEAIPHLGLVINLCFTTNPYYFVKEFEDFGVVCKFVKCMGHEVPTKDNIEDFTTIVEEFLSSEGSYDKLIGVHCTHGVNRTGYVVCRYLIDSLGFDPDTAINEFAKARGHKIERQNYLDALYDKSYYVLNG